MVKILHPYAGTYRQAAEKYKIVEKAEKNLFEPERKK